MSEVLCITANNGEVMKTAFKYNVSNKEGSGPEDIVKTNVEFVWDQTKQSYPPLPSSGQYSVQVTPDQPCYVSVSNKTVRGFDVFLVPMLGKKIHAGAFDVTVSWR